MPNPFASLSLANVGLANIPIVGPGLARGYARATNEIRPDMAPPPEWIIRGIRSGMMDRSSGQQMLKSHAISYGEDIGNEFANNYAAGWEYLSMLMGDFPTPREIVDFWHRGFFGDVEGAGEKAALIYLPRAGDYDGFWSKWGDIIRSFPSPETSLVLMNRGLYNTAEGSRKIRAMTGWTDEDILAFRELRFLTPPPSDLIRFMVREAFDENKARELDLDSGYDPRGPFAAWAASQGYARQTLNIPGFGPYTADWAKMYWRSHWHLPSPGQAYDMLHKLRPGRTERWAIAGRVPPVFTPQDLDALLTANDYAEKWRLPLAAIAYRPQGLRDIRRVFMYDVIDYTELREKFLDIGYSPDDATELSDQMQREKDEKKGKEATKQFEREMYRFAKAAGDAYQIGAINKSELVQTLVRNNFYEPAARLRADSLEVDVNKRIIKEYIEQIRKEFFLGLYTNAQAIEELQSVGVDQEMTFKLVPLWRRKMSRARKIASTETIKKWFRMGIIGEREAILRLRNLGWTNVENMYNILETWINIDKDILAEQLRAERNEERRQAKLKQARREREQAERHARVEFEKHSGKELMKQWVKLGLLDRNEAFARWSYLYPAGIADFDLWWEGVTNG